MEISLAQKSRSDDATLLCNSFIFFRKFPIEHLLIQYNGGHILHRRQLNEKISSMKWMVDSDDADAFSISCVAMINLQYISCA